MLPAEEKGAVLKHLPTFIPAPKTQLWCKYVKMAISDTKALHKGLRTKQFFQTIKSYIYGFDHYFKYNSNAMTFPFYMEKNKLM